MHQKAVMYVLPYHGNDKDGFTLVQRWMLLKKMTFISFKKKRQILWSFMLASTVVSRDGVLCVKEVGASVQQPLQTFGRFYSYL